MRKFENSEFQNERGYVSVTYNWGENIVTLKPRFEKKEVFTTISPLMALDDYSRKVDSLKKGRS